MSLYVLLGNVMVVTPVAVYMIFHLQGAVPPLFDSALMIFVTGSLLNWYQVYLMQFTMIRGEYTAKAVSEFYDAALFATTAPLFTYPAVTVLLIASMFQDDLDGSDSDMTFNELYMMFVGWLIVVSLASLV